VEKAQKQSYLNHRKTQAGVTGIGLKLKEWVYEFRIDERQWFGFFAFRNKKAKSKTLINA